MTASGGTQRMDEILVRPIAIGDIEQFWSVTNAVMRERQFLAYFGFPLDECATFVARNMRLGNPQIVAEHAGRLVGWCDIQRETVPAYAHTGVLGLGVLAEFRGRGVGERLVRAAIDAAKLANFERLELSVYDRNTRAAALYRKVGFVHEGTRVRGKKVDGEFDDVHMMGMLL